MTTTAVDTQLDVAARVLDLVRAQAGGRAEAEVYVDRTELALTRFANSYIHQNVADSTTRVRLRLHLDGRTAVGSATGFDGLAELVARTVTASRLSQPDPGWPGLAPPAPTAGTGHVDEAIAAATPADRADRVRAFVDAAGGLTAAGYFRTRYTSVAFANSAGQAVAGAGTECSMDGIARTRSSDGVARLASHRLADVDGAVLGARAAAKARAGENPVELPPGGYEVVLEPGAVVDVLRHLALHGFNGKAHLERRSFVRLGEPQFDPAVTLVEDGTAPEAMWVPFDTEGSPKRRYELVSAGVTSRVAHDRRTAAQAGTESTGNAFQGARSFGPFPISVHLTPAEATGPTTEVDGPAADSSVLALVAGVRRGLLVTDFWYTRILDPRPLVVTGLTRNGLWLIENGEVTRPVQNLRFTQAYPKALGPEAVLGVGTQPMAHPADWTGDSIVAPALRLASWKFTGGASG
jgi:predicted Zn-dependent protease